jgi:hypothetical protein
MEGGDNKDLTFFEEMVKLFQYDYECPSNLPVKWCTHNGGHTDLPMVPGQSKSWDIDLTWKLITQF